MKTFFIAAICVLSITTFAQINNVTLLSHLDEYHSAGYNDIWGYVDGSGNEYALLGVRSGTSIINITDPQNPVEAAFIPGPFSVWRDIKTHSTYAYAVTEQTGSGQGLQIIDLSQLPTTATLVNTIDTWFSSAHNIFIDNGYAYVIGTNGGGGMHILDLSNPTNPTETNYYTGSGYIHDVYVWDDTVVACAEDDYQLVDVSNKSNPQWISASQQIPKIYAHSGWMTEDKRYFYGTEELNNVDITVWDLQDRSTWDLAVSSWELSGGATVHNLFIKGNFAHISYYSSGYVVLDITDPENPQLAGQYDTADMWGCYPYLPSGSVVCSDIDDGLYVFQFEGEVPVELTAFTGSAVNQNVTLSWSTATETNNQGFEIQRKYSHEFKTIAFVEGNGTTTETKNYNYTDKNLELGTYSYRLKQVDFDGRFNFSDEIIVEVTQPSDFTLNQNYPNPFNPSTKISFNLPADGIVNLKIFNSLGEEVAELANNFYNAGTHSVTFNAINFPSGIYIAKLQAANNVSTIKMSLLK